MPKLEEFLPLTQTTFLILASLMDGQKHGYAIIKDVEWRTEQTVRLGIGNLYVALKRLLDQGLVERAGEEIEGEERRKTYRVSGLGQRVFKLETERQQRMMAANPLLRPGDPEVGEAHWQQRAANADAEHPRDGGSSAGKAGPSTSVAR